MRIRDGSSDVCSSDLLEITLEDAFNGKEVELQIDSTAACEPCGGSGAKPGTAARTCNMCDGRGQVRASQGFFVVERTCPGCRGVGEVIARSEEHTYELQSLMRISYAVFCLKKK